MTICYFGIYNPDYSRNRIYISGLRANGIEVIECSDRSRGLMKYFKLIAKHRLVNGKYDAMIVGYPGYTVVWLARLLTGKPIIYDALCTHYEAQVLSRGIYPLWSPRRWMTYFYDHSSVHFADQVLVETEAQKKYFEHLFKTPPNKVKVLLAGADDKEFFPEAVEKNGRFSVVFRGRFLPEIGIRYIVEAANILQSDDIDFLIIGNGHGPVVKELHDAIKRFNPTNLAVESSYLPADGLRQMMLRGHVLLGQFADHDRLKRTIPYKAFEALALSMPFITSRAEGHTGFLVDGTNCLLVNPADAKDLAEKIKHLKDHPDISATIAKNGHELFLREATPKVLGKILAGYVSESLPKS